MKLILDVNLSPAWVSFLQEHGLEADHWSSLGLGEAPDTEIAAFAVEHQRIIVTGDLDFGIALAQNRHTAPSVIQIRVKSPDPEIIGLQVVRAITDALEHLQTGSLVMVSSKRTRHRLLPISAKPPKDS